MTKLTYVALYLSPIDAFWIARDTVFRPANNEDSDQTAEMARLI